MSQSNRRSQRNGDAHPNRAPRAHAGGNGRDGAAAAAGRRSAAHEPEGLAAEAGEMALVLECARLADEELPLGLAYQRFLDLVHRAMPFAHGTLYVTEWGSGRLTPVAVRGNRVELADEIRFARGSGLSAWVAQEGRAVVIPDPGANGHRSPFADAALRAFLAFPLVHDGVVAGVVALTRTDRTFSEAEFERLGRLATPLGNTLAKLRRETRLRQLIYLDAETGVSNHRHFLARLEEELQRARQHATEFSVALLEVADDSAADGGLVQSFTRQLQDAMRSCDIVASLGQGRFGLLLAGVNLERAGVIVDRIARSALRDASPATHALRLRVGLAGSGEAGVSPDGLIRQAEDTLREIA